MAIGTFREWLREEEAIKLTEASIELEFNKKLSKLIKAYDKVKNRYVVIKSNADGSFLVLVDMNGTNKTTATLNNGKLSYKQISLWGKTLTGGNDISIYSVQFIDTLLDAIKEKNFIDK